MYHIYTISWSPAQVTLAAQASKALNIINRVNYNCNYSFKAVCDIFDKCVLPVVSYGSDRVRFWAVQNLFWAGRCPKLGLNPPFTAQNCPKLPKTAQNCPKLPADYKYAKLILG